jgi:hypothetical protein
VAISFPLFELFETLRVEFSQNRKSHSGSIRSPFLLPAGPKFLYPVISR